MVKDMVVVMVAIEDVDVNKVVISGDHKDRKNDKKYTWESGKFMLSLWRTTAFAI
ncbi:hypothetical protein J1N35_036740 [Gossypium stocksii]|uniref:Uncharacterized protein n=1 Tax=Gossypium stocksii TaxID=47602 RepID=A0A9D3UIX0_9ROSI|nr:hypothetical protein J1N35_036740 [Gossypium stocksii]